jgi:uncharacterized protein
MLSAELLEILVCPESKTPVRLADEALVASVNEKIAAGTVHNVAGQRVTRPLEEALIREDGLRLYPVLGGIPVMLIDESIALEKDPS